jgi:hypothetical protein
MDDTPASWPGWLDGVFESLVDGKTYREEAAGIVPAYILPLLAH